MMKISQKTFDAIVGFEVTSKPYYDRHYTKPEWPGGMSGVTVGIGYDLGYASVEKIKSDWRGKVPVEVLSAMITCAGIKGSDAKAKCAEVKRMISVPWSAAIDVFANRDIPNWTSSVLNKVSGAKILTPTCLGVQVSVVYNRGASYDLPGDRYAEMRAMKQHINSGEVAKVSFDLRAMKRLWPGVKGLQDRRDREATLNTEGLIDNAPPMVLPDTPEQPDPEVPLNEGPARTKPPATTSVQHGTAGTIIVAGGAAAQQAHAYGLIGTPGLIFCGFLAVLAAVTVWVLIYRNRNP